MTRYVGQFTLTKHSEIVVDVDENALPDGVGIEEYVCDIIKATIKEEGDDHDWAYDREGDLDIYHICKAEKIEDEKTESDRWNNVTCQNCHCMVMVKEKDIINGVYQGNFDCGNTNCAKKLKGSSKTVQRPVEKVNTIDRVDEDR